MPTAPSGPDLRTVARLDLPCAAVEVQRLALAESMDGALPASDRYRIDHCLTARIPEARMSFADRWPAHRFEALGRVYLVPPGEAARARSGAGSQEAVICWLDPAAMEGWLEGHGDGIGRALDAGLDIRSVAVARLMQQLAAETRAPGLASAALCEALAVQLAIELARFYLDREQTGTAVALAGWRLALIEERVRLPAPPPTLAELADLCGVSVRHLTRGFRASRGCSIGAYIRDHQIALAKHGLARGESVKAIAHRLGFASRSSFSHAFRRDTGLAPHQFRQGLPVRTN